MSFQKIQLLKNTTIMPLNGSMSSFTGGLFTSDGQFVEDSLLYRGRPAELQKALEHLSGTYIYGGCFFCHFGHFIWETLSRLYAIRCCKNYPILFINSDDEYFEVYKKIFKTLGVNNEIHFIKTPTSVENIIYSPPGSALVPLTIIDEQINALKYYYFEEKDKNSNEKIWLSRSRWLFGTVTNEQIIEKILSKQGYRIVHPEELSLQEQIRLASTSDIVAGFDGSQFYSILFATDISSTFHVFNRRARIPQEIPYVFQKRNTRFEIHHFNVEHICGREAWSYYTHSEPERIIEILRNT